MASNATSFKKQSVGWLVISGRPSDRCRTGTDNRREAMVAPRRLPVVRYDVSGIGHAQGRAAPCIADR